MKAFKGARFGGQMQNLKLTNGRFMELCRASIDDPRKFLRRTLNIWIFPQSSLNLKMGEMFVILKIDLQSHKKLREKSRHFEVDAWDLETSKLFYVR